MYTLLEFRSSWGPSPVDGRDRGHDIDTVVERVRGGLEFVMRTRARHLENLRLGADAAQKLKVPVEKCLLDFIQYARGLKGGDWPVEYGKWERAFRDSIMGDYVWYDGLS